jgi:GNAT superfamily N-acetyltransferase
MMAGMGPGWVVRPGRGAADRPLVEALWLAALAERWPLLPRAVGRVRDGFFAEVGGRPAGFVAVDLAGSVPLMLVAPGQQGRGIGTALLGAARRRLHAAGVSTVRAGSGGTDSIWPGVPLDLPAAVGLFTARGWRSREDTLDLVASLPGYRAPAPARAAAAAGAGVTISLAAGPDRAAVLAFEDATFPHWSRWYRGGNGEALLARDAAGAVVATLLLDGPGAPTVFEPMLGPSAATINCVGVAPRAQGRGIGTALVARASEILRDRGAGTCHISWTVRESFYARAGYQPWRRYRMFQTEAGPGRLCG